jgi:phosphatidylglycerophosphate synthase
MSHSLLFAQRLDTRVERWSAGNAVLLLGATGLAWWTHTPWLIAATGALSLTALVVLAAPHWTPQQSFGPANTLTVLRLLAICALAIAPSAWPAPVACAVGLAVLLADGLDGWIARRRETASVFGEFFDKETDALFLLLLCVLHAFAGTLPVWVVGVGVLRYVFVLALFIPSHIGREHRSTIARYVYCSAVLAFLASFLPYPAVYRPLVALASAALLWSFARSFWWIYTVRTAQRPSA